MKDLKILIIGYGKMGKEIEKIAHVRFHKIVATVDDTIDWEKKEKSIREADVAIDFSVPDLALDHILRCQDLNIPLVMGTTGWYDHLEKVKEETIQRKTSFLWASNFSLGVNILFHFNKKLAEIMANFPEYQASIHEMHHNQKIDAPSGTAISLAKDIVAAIPTLNDWYLQNDYEIRKSDLPISYERIGLVTGTHIVKYQSNIDEISLMHEAKNRKGFAQGAVLGAEWLIGKNGFFEMKDVLGF